MPEAFEIGAEVVRTAGLPFQIGAKGTVQAATPSRVRVRWHTWPGGYQGATTWVNQNQVTIAPKED
jgi:hypothetical protein